MIIFVIGVILLLIALGVLMMAPFVIGYWFRSRYRVVKQERA